MPITLKSFYNPHNYVVTYLHCDFSTATSSKNETVHKQTESSISAWTKNVTEAWDPGMQTNNEVIPLK